MGRSIELSGDWLGRCLYALQLLGAVLVLGFVVFPLDGAASVPLAVLFASLVVVTALGWWRRTPDGEGNGRLGTAEDITYDPFADPGQAARDRWGRAVRRLPGEDDGED
jgi:hypothetical protein